jgi:hypothetical protein
MALSSLTGGSSLRVAAQIERGENVKPVRCGSAGSPRAGSPQRSSILRFSMPTVLAPSAA